VQRKNSERLRPAPEILVIRSGASQITADNSQKEQQASAVLGATICNHHQNNI
jgi:hypothetical protein